MPNYVELFEKVLNGYGCCNEADGYSECRDCPYADERAESCEPWPGLGMCTPLYRDIGILALAMQKLNDTQASDANKEE
jgi:hypothetical protein